MEDQTVVNAATNEEFSVSKYEYRRVEVKRTRAPKKKEKTSETVNA